MDEEKIYEANEGEKARWEKILKIRAQELSREIATGKELHAAGEELYLNFSLRGGNYAIKIEHIIEVIQLGDFITVPCTPSHIYGIIRLRGQVIALVDLMAFWQQRRYGIVDSDQAIIVNVGGLTFGIICGVIQGVASIARADIKPPPANFNSVAVKYTRGILPDWRIVLNLNSIMQEEGFIVNDKIK